MPSTSTRIIPAHWDDATGVIIALLDAENEQVDDYEDAVAAVWLCMTGAYEGQEFHIDLFELDLASVH
jgi:hypothetical protein